VHGALKNCCDLLDRRPSPVCGRQVADGLDGQPVELKAFAGKVLLVTNVASACGYTEKNYQGLQQLYDRFRDRGFEARARPTRPARVLVAAQRRTLLAWHGRQGE
jgi:hypothetical protein